jgi:hypothetical protein
MKRYMLAPMVGVVLAGSGVRAAPPRETPCGAAGRAAEELRRAGDLSGARARLAACVSTGCASPLRERCARQLAEIDAAIPTVVVQVKDDRSNDLTAVRVMMDGAPMLDGLDGTAMFVNPGEHHLVLEAAGFRRTEATFVAREGEKSLRVVVFVDHTRSVASNRANVSAEAGAPSLVGRSQAPTAFARRRNLGIALGCVGIGGVAVGAALAILSKVTYDHALASECGGDANRCSPQGIDDGRMAHRQAGVATVAFGTAGALFAAGAALYFTSPKQAGVAVAPAVAEGGGLMVVGKW